MIPHTVLCVGPISLGFRPESQDERGHSEGAGGCPRLSAWPSASHSPASPCRLTSARTTLTTASGGCSPSWQGRWVSPRAPRHALWPMRRETWSSSSGGLQREGGEGTKGTEAERICSRDGSAPSRRPSPVPSPGLRPSWGPALGSSASPGALIYLFFFCSPQLRHRTRPPLLDIRKII